MTPEPLIHLRYMGIGASCNPTRRANLTNDLNEVTCGSCKATKYYKKQKQQLCEHNETLMLEEDQYECVDCGKIISFEEQKRNILERD